MNYYQHQKSHFLHSRYQNSTYIFHHYRYFYYITCSKQEIFKCKISKKDYLGYFLDHRQCKQLQFWLHNCFVLDLTGSLTKFISRKFCTLQKNSMQRFKFRSIYLLFSLFSFKYNYYISTFLTIMY